MKTTSRVGKNFFYSLISMIILMILGIVVPRIVLTGYGSEVNGLLTSVTQFIVYLGLFESGIQGVAKQSLYKYVCLDDKKEINGILSAVNKYYRKIGFEYGIVLIFLAFIYPFFVHTSVINYWSIFFVVFFSGLGNVILFFYQGKYKILMEVEGKNYIITNLQTIISVLNNITKIIFLSLKIDIAIVIFSSFVISLLQVIYIEWLMKSKYKWIDLSVTPNYFALSQKNSMLIHQIAGMVFQNTDVIILTWFCDLKVVSVYSLYKLIINYLESFLNAVYNSFDFKLGQIFNTDINKFKNYINIVESYFGAIVFSVFTVTYCLMTPFMQIYTAGINDITYVDYKLVFLFILCEVLNYIRIPMLKTINYAGRFTDTLKQSIMESVINIVVSIIGVIKYGIYGVLFGTIVALMYRTMDVIIYSNKVILKRPFFHTLYIYLIDILAMICIVLCYLYINLKITNLVYFLLHGVILLMVSTIIIVLLQTIIQKENRIFVLNIIKKINIKKLIGGILK